MPTTFHGVLLSDDLMLRISRFQQGVPQQVLPLATYHQPTSSIPMSEVPAITSLIHQWLTLHGQRQLPKLLTWCPRVGRLLLIHAVATGQVNLLQVCLSSLVESVENLMDVAAYMGQLKMAVALVPYTLDDDAIMAAMFTAVSRGHLNIVEFLHRQLPSKSPQLHMPHLMDVAASNGHLSVVRFLHFNRHEGCTTLAMDQAASRGHLDVLDFLHVHRQEGCTSAAMTLASTHGHVPVMKWLVEHRTRMAWRWSDAISSAAANGHVDVLGYIYLIKPRAGWTKQAMDIAACNGHVDVMRFLHRHRKDGCSEAAEALATANGHVEVVAYLKEHGDELVHCVCCACGFVKPRSHACAAVARAAMRRRVCVK
ncbi:hypothetical protein DYB28_000661 [Aphanomyces astaci]|uniref:Ankyrin repeat-containing domain n=2 Tax=Aphanomyces astaci TaxID=112090 RepID=A0A9X8H2J4_APHAT|nr:hypothetical protein DYB28_000661 [Aphanomyces astaci]